MCGLVGMYGSGFDTFDAKILHNLLHFDQLRGNHSTGVYFLYDNLEYEIMKCTGTPELLYWKYRIKDSLFDLKNVTTVIGHNRYATQGKIDDKTAHPFDIGSVIGAHNGTISSWGIKELEDSTAFDIDSQVLLNHISKKGVEDMWPKVYGAMALTWSDKKDGSFHVARNSDRPLLYKILDSGKKMYWASEKWMLVVALSRNNEKFDGIKEFEVDKHYRFSLDKDKKIVMEVKDLPLYVFKPIHGKQGGKNWYGSGAYYGHYDYQTATSDVDFVLTDWTTNVFNADKSPKSGYFLGWTGDETVKITVHNIDTKVLDTIKRLDDNTENKIYKLKHVYYSELNGSATGYNMVITGSWVNVVEVDSTETVTVLGKDYTRAEWIKLVYHGCSICGDDFLWDDRNEIVWGHIDSPVCKKCDKVYLAG